MIFACFSFISKLRISSSEANAIARLHNSRISNLETAFHPLRDHQNVVPDIFPANGYALLTLNCKKRAAMMKINFTDLS